MRREKIYRILNFVNKISKFFVLLIFIILSMSAIVFSFHYMIITQGKTILAKPFGMYITALFISFIILIFSKLFIHIIEVKRK